MTTARCFSHTAPLRAAFTTSTNRHLGRYARASHPDTTTCGVRFTFDCLPSPYAPACERLQLLHSFLPGRVVAIAASFHATCPASARAPAIFCSRMPLRALPHLFLPLLPGYRPSPPAPYCCSMTRCARRAYFCTTPHAAATLPTLLPRRQSSVRGWTCMPAATPTYYYKHSLLPPRCCAIFTCNYVAPPHGRKERRGEPSSARGGGREGGRRGQGRASTAHARTTRARARAALLPHFTLPPLLRLSCDWLYLMSLRGAAHAHSHAVAVCCSRGVPPRAAFV